MLGNWNLPFWHVFYFETARIYIFGGLSAFFCIIFVVLCFLSGGCCCQLCQGLWFSRVESWSRVTSRLSFQSLGLGLECMSLVLVLGLGLEALVLILCLSLGLDLETLSLGLSLGLEALGLGLEEASLDNMPRCDSRHFWVGPLWVVCVGCSQVYLGRFSSANAVSWPSDKSRSELRRTLCWLSRTLYASSFF